MNPFVVYSIPIQGLKTAIHTFRYELDRSFFEKFEDSPIADCTLRYQVQLDKRPDMLVLDFELEGTVEASCARCAADIHLPIEGERQLIVKYGDAEGETEDEVVFIHREASEFNVAPYLYEFAVLALPITNTYDCQSDEHPPCNFEVLDYLKNESSVGSNAIWEVLKGKLES
jgi:uncharacterized metal-binding protein YceD (DUF177 family)